MTNLRFADDVILAAQSLSDIRKMLNDLSVFAAAYGFEINFDKTKILTWNALAGACQEIKVGDENVAVLDETASEKYLGRKLSFHDCHAVELKKTRLLAGPRCTTTRQNFATFWISSSDLATESDYSKQL